jgi:molybdate transport system substrate-binding protein
MRIKILTLLMLGGLAHAAAAGEVKLAVAANFTDVTNTLAPLFASETGHTLVASFGSTGKLYAQVENGAPFEVLLAADDVRPSKAEAEGLAVTGTAFTYAYGKLVLWSAQSGYATAGVDVLKQAGFERLAIANPKTAPYGAAAEQVLVNLGLHDTLAAKLVRGDSIAQTMQFALTGNAQLGFVAMSQVKALPPEKAGSSWEVPQGLYDPIAQQAVLLKKGEHNPAAHAFMTFLRSATAKEVIRRYGYAVD